jgi:DNA polymerase I
VDSTTANPDAPVIAPERVYLLDTHGLVFQMFHGMPPMNSPDGRPTNAVFGVTRAIMDLYDRGATYLLATFDTEEPTFRVDLFPEYKGHRDPPPEDLVAQLPMIDQVLNAMGVPVLKLPGYEADDIIATLSRQADERGCEVFLCSSDKDCRQLLTDRVKIQNLRKGEVLDAVGLFADWGIRPDQVIDYQTLVGDSVDNISGVPGCGAKTASKWLAEYGTLEKILANVDYLGGPKLRESVKKAMADGTIELCKKLVTLRTDAPIPFDWDGWRRRDWHGQQLLELFQDFGFRGFANRVRSTLAKVGATKNAELIGVTAVAVDEPSKMRKPRPSQPSLFDLIDGNGEPGSFAVEPPFDDGWIGDYQLVETPEEFENFVLELRLQNRFAIDLETTGLDPLRAEIVGIAVAWKVEHAFYLPMRGPKGSNLLNAAETLAAFKPLLEDPAIGKVNQNIKYDMLVLRQQGIHLAGIVGDSMIADYLLHAGERLHNLDDMTLRYFKHTNIPIESLIGKNGKKQIKMDAVPTAKVCTYAGEDADAALRLADLLEPQLEPLGLRKLYDELELPLINVLAEMEFNGVRLDVPKLKLLSEEMAGQLAGIEAEIYQLAGREFNIGSLPQLRTVLFDELNLPIQKRTGTTGDASTDQESLERLAALGHELPRKLIEQRQVSKLKSTYVDALPAIANPFTGRVHTSFNQSVTFTGRLSSSDPNLQNIPTRREQGRQIRQAFIAQTGWQILRADYSQIELRLLAHFCDDANMLQAFHDDRDIHASVAAQVFKVPEAEVTKDQRRVAKTVNFGVIYGISAVGLAIGLSISKKEAATFIDDYFARYPSVQQYQDALLAKGRADGFVSTILGRRRTFGPGSIRPRSTYRQRNQAEREAINMEIQGSAADLMKLAMLKVHARMKREKLEAKLLLSVHDELVFEVPPVEVTVLAKLVREEMTGAMTLKVPLKVDVASGPNWLDGEEV